MSKNHKKYKIVEAEIIVENGVEYITDGYHKISRQVFEKITQDNEKGKTKNALLQSEDKI